MEIREETLKMGFLQGFPKSSFSISFLNTAELTGIVNLVKNLSHSEHHNTLLVAPLEGQTGTFEYRS